MYRTFCLLIAVFCFTATLFAQEDSFKVEDLTDGTQLLVTPFAEIPAYWSDLDKTDHKGRFTVTEWNAARTIFTVKTSDGEHATFSKEGDNWRYINTVNGEPEDNRECTWVGRRLAWSIFQQLQYSKSTMRVEGEKIVSQENDLINSEPFSLPTGVQFKLIRDNKVMLLWDSFGYNFKEGSFFGPSEGKYLIVYPRLWRADDGRQMSMWSYTLGNMSSGFDEISVFVNKLMVSILSRECDDYGKNRYGEVEIKSATGNSSIFFNQAEQTARLGKGWNNGGKVFRGTKFVVDEGDSKWRVIISGDQYAAEQVK